jgi:hypothetical protein
VAPPALYARFPDLALAVSRHELRNKPVVTQNDLYELPVRLRQVFRDPPRGGFRSA